MTDLREQVAKALYCADEGIDAAANVAHVNCWFGPDATGDGTWPDDYRRMATAAIRVVLEALEEPGQAAKEAATEISIDTGRGHNAALNWEEADAVWSTMHATAIRQLGGEGE